MRVDFSEINSKVKLYLAVGRFEAAEKLLQNCLDEHGSMANIHNLLGVTLHKQSKFPDAIVQFTKALKINPSFVEAGLNLSATLCDLGRYEDARSIFSELSTQAPTNKKQPNLILGRLANHHASCGTLYEQSGFTTEAIAEYKRALSLYERMPDVRLALGKLLFRSGQLDRALQEFQTVASDFPDETEAHVWLGIAQWKLGQSEQAKRVWETARSLGGDDGVAAAYLRMQQELSSSAKNSR